MLLISDWATGPLWAARDPNQHNRPVFLPRNQIPLGVGWRKMRLLALRLLEERGH